MSKRGTLSDKQISDEQMGTEGQDCHLPFTPTPGTIADLLRRRLLALEYPAFSQCLCVLLEALGYEEARPAGRQEWKGYNRPGGGGYDLEAMLTGGLAPRRVVAQIKQFDSLNVHQRSVDELRGACLRCGAAEAILVTTSAFSNVVLRHASEANAASTPVAPVRLIDGKELLGLLIRYRLGVRERARGGTCRLEIDEAFFGMVGALLARETDARTSAGEAAKPKWRVTIRVSSVSCPKTRTGGATNARPGKDKLGKGGR